MKIIYIFDTFNSGGAGRQFILLLKYLTSAGEEVKIIVLEGKKYYEDVKALGLDIVLVQREHKRDIKPLFTVSKIISNYKPDIVHSWGWMSTFAAHSSCFFNRIPLVGSLRTASYPVKAKDKAISFIKNKLLKHTISNSLAALVANKISPPKGHVVYNGFDISRIPEASKKYPKFTIVMAARMSNEKDWKCFIDAISIVSGSNLNMEIDFLGLGDGANRKELLVYGREVIDKGILKLSGFVKEPMNWLVNADVGVLLSPPGVCEGTSNSILEYMACSLPVICTGAGGNLETVVEKETGLYVQVQNASELAKKIVFLYNNQDTAKKMGLAGKKRVLDKYSIEVMGSNTLDIYKQIVSTNY